MLALRHDIYRYLRRFSGEAEGATNVSEEPAVTYDCGFFVYGALKRARANVVLTAYNVN